MNIKNFFLIIICLVLTACSSSNSTKRKGVSFKDACYIFEKCFFIGVSNSPEASPLPDVKITDTTIKTQWKARVGDRNDDKSIKLRPVHNGKVVLVASYDGTIARYQLSNGAREWEITAGQPITAGLAIGGDNVIVGTKDGWVEAFSLKTGKFKWRQQLSSEILARPAVVNGVLGVRTVDGQISGVDVRTGKVLWRSGIGMPALSIRRQADVLKLGDLFLIATSKGRLVAFDAKTGRQAISVPLILGKGKTRIEQLSDFSATPFLMGRVLILSGYGQRTLAVDLQSKKVLWESKIHTAQDIYADRRYVYLVSPDSSVNALHLQSGKLAWKNEELVGRNLSPAAGNGYHVTVTDDEGYMYLINTEKGNVEAIDKLAASGSNVGMAFIDQNSFLNFSRLGELSLARIDSIAIKNMKQSTLPSFSLPAQTQKKYSFAKPAPNQVTPNQKQQNKKPTLSTPSAVPSSTPLSFPSN